MTGRNRELAIDQDLFLMAFGRDVDYHDIFPQLTYLDRRTGEIIWVYETDDSAYMEAGIPAGENRQDRERVNGDPDRYLEFPGLDHSDQIPALRRDPGWRPHESTDYLRPR